tara:strand:+ start:285 stop:2141 length:1857 start_codon:yes stop_codon:yes gene_type:complete
MFARFLNPHANLPDADPIAKMLHKEGITTDKENGVVINENGAIQISKNGLSDDKRKAAYLELFIKLVRDNTSTDMVLENVESILKYNTDSEITDMTDGILRQMAMTRSFRISIGKGEKLQSQYLMMALYKNMPNLMSYIIPVASREVGCWKDIVVMSQYCIDNEIYPKLVDSITKVHSKAIQDGDYLASKWAPREKSSFLKVAKHYVKHIYGNRNQNSWKKYRALLKKNCSSDKNFLLETAMCSRNWDYIGKMLPKLTALNHTKYRKAFDKHIQKQYSEYLSEAASGNKKINTTGLHIDGIVKTMLKGGQADHGAVFNSSLSENELKLLNLQWKKIEDDMVKLMLEDEKVYSTFSNQVSVIDRSGSMQGVCHVAVALGLFIAKVLGRAGREKYGNDYIGFGDVVIRFSDNAEVISLNPTNNFNEYLEEYITKENRFDCGYSTKIMSVHEKVVNLTKKCGLNQAPDLIILTDMQYNQVCDTRTGARGLHQNKQIDEFYNNSDVNRGETRSWNLRGNTASFEAEGDIPGVVMIGGFNQTMLTLFSEGKDVAEASGKDRKNVTTWDTFLASQKHYNMATQWLKDGIEAIKELEDLSLVEKQLVSSIPSNYVSIWAVEEEEV